MIERICQRCGKEFYTFPSRIKVGNAKYCSRNCINGLPQIKMICQQCGKEFEVYNCRTQNNRRKYCSNECKYEAQRNKVTRICEYCGEELVVSPSRIKLGFGRYCSIRCGCKGKIFSQKHRQKISEAFKKLWQQPEYIRMELSALRIRPTKPELQLRTVLNKHFPQFKYNGDFSLGITLGGLIPDFVNVNGKKEVIEVFGEYWHSRENIRWNYTELGRIMAYNSLGYRCLVIWDNELRDEQAVISKIKKVFLEKLGGSDESQ